jgi:hypothetical protein
MWWGLLCCLFKRAAVPLAKKGVKKGMEKRKNAKAAKAAEAGEA